LWLGSRQADRWRRAHRLAATAFLERAAAGRCGGVADAERALDSLLAASPATPMPRPLSPGWTTTSLPGPATRLSRRGQPGVAALLEQRRH